MHLSSAFDATWQRYKEGSMSPMEFLQYHNNDIGLFARWAEAKILAEKEHSPITPAELKKLAVDLAPLDKNASHKINDLFLRLKMPKFVPPQEKKESSEFAEALKQFPEEQRATLRKVCWPLLQNHPFSSLVIGKILETVVDIEPILREATLVHVITMTNYGQTDGAKIATLDSIKAIAADRRADVVRQVAPLTRGVDFIIGDVAVLQRILPLVNESPLVQIGDLTGKIIAFLQNVAHPARFDILDRLKNSISQGERLWALEQANRYVYDRGDSGAIRLDTLMVFVGIPPDVRDAFVTRVEFFANMATGPNQIVDCLRHLTLLPPSPRAALVIHTHFTDLLSLLTAINQLVRAVMFGGGGAKVAYEIHVVRDELETTPTMLLNTLTDMFEAEEQTSLKISYEGEEGVDAGGLGRQFISDLFSGVLKAVGCPKDLNSGLYSPKLEEPNSQKQKIYQQLGQVMKFCLNATTEYPIGILFDESVFKAILEFDNADLDRPFDDLLKEFDGLFRVYEAINSPQKIANIRPHITTPEGKAQFAQDYMGPELLPLFELAKGLKFGPSQNRLRWLGIRRMAPAALSKQLQGSISRPELVSKLQFDPRIPEAKRSWVKRWLETANNELLKQFLYTLTGSSSIGSMQIKIQDNSPSREDQEAALFFHTCFNAVDIPFAKLTSEEQFKTIFEAALGGTKKYNRA